MIVKELTELMKKIMKIICNENIKCKRLFIVSNFYERLNRDYNQLLAQEVCLNANKISKVMMRTNHNINEFNARNKNNYACIQLVFSSDATNK
jgi:hypothetical protein